MSEYNDKPMKENPYLNARREWNERYGSHIKAANSWRLSSHIQSVIILLAVGALIYASSKSQSIPFIIKTCSGNVVSAEFPSEGAAPSPDLVKSELIEWLLNLRRVTSDGKLQRSFIDSVYAKLRKSTAATKTVSDWYQKNPPIGSSELVRVQPETILQVSENSWQIEWLEFKTDLQGEIIGKPAKMKATIKISFYGLKSKKQILENPLGLFIDTIDWMQRI